MGNKMKYGAAVVAAGVLLGGLGWSGQVVDASSSKAKVTVAAQKSAKSEIALKWNGKALTQKGMLDNGTVFVPATAIRDALGIPLKYDAKNRTYTIGNGYNKLSAAVYANNEIYLTVNGYDVGEPGGKIVNGRLYIPYKVLNEYMGVQGQWNSSLKSLSMTPKKQNSITIKSATLKKKVLNVEAVANYPVVSGLENEQAQTEINKVLKKNAEDVITAAEGNVGTQPPSGTKYPYEFQGDFVVHYNAQGLLSITAYDYTYTGGAHGMTFRNSFTFSLKDGKQLKLGDVINMQSKNKQKLNNLVLNKMKKDGGYLGGFKSVPADADFYLKDNAAVLYFQLYDYTAYAYGFPQFELNLKEWK
ncbi:Copper amine oxidase N-terminal domain-containing protein [Paenibacillus uliginis N3/975]|uniref:Copper amine oxidase N-terminal domain-containing protein n=1 Tax=Paenibacillus uliginis N3/975 TaxID=1313296 RepID=A0A1X7HUZ3_9BACL|nr:DUF4163 domain-containing protein [Paenibacillus uliginis]SMF92380.1 Copper amine oxidase N-terminal domain-containing protein [Paenibacillus uliginis N3/975]